MSYVGSLAIHASLLLFFLFSNEFQLILNPQGSSLTDTPMIVTFFSLNETSERPLVRTNELQVSNDKSTDLTVKQKRIKKSMTSAGLINKQIKDIIIQKISQAVGTSDGAKEIQPLSDYLFGLRRLIDSKKIYPSLSRRMGETGKVLLSFEVLRNGTIQEIRIKTRSQFERLDQAALETVSNFEKYSPLPDSVSEDRIVVEVPIEFLL